MDFNEQYEQLKEARLNEITNPNMDTISNSLIKNNYAFVKLELVNGRNSYINPITGNRILLPKFLF